MTHCDSGDAMSLYLNVYPLLPRSTDTTVSRHLILIAPKRQPDTGTMVFLQAGS